MKCYYEVLEVARDADDGEIKTAYRKLALKWHPDKNIDNPDEAKVQFQLVQQAYEVLSDRHERAWYDNHREQILRGSNKDYEDDSLDVYQYFTTQCFKGYGDDENGFYTVYRTVFDKIAQEDIQHMDSKSDFDEIPSFGNSLSDYDDIVGPFYAYWSSYTTKKSYVWLDTYNINEARNARELKFIEKENKKVRLKAKKERNEEVRNLVAFVRKRDKRVQANAKRLEAKIAENRSKQEQLRKQKILENKKALEETTEAHWSKFDNVQHELEQIEKNLAAEFGENLSETDSENSDTENDLYCVVCNKIFKTVKAFENHESSKKHKENVELLKQSMLEEEENLSGTPSVDESFDDSSDVNELFCTVCNKEYKTLKAFRDHETGQKHLQNLEKLNGSPVNESIENGEENLNQEDPDNLDIEENFIEKETLSTKKKNKKSKKVIRTQKLSTTSDENVEKPSILEISDDDFEFNKSKRSKKKNKPKTEPKKTENVSPVEIHSSEYKDDISETKNDVSESKKDVSENKKDVLDSKKFEKKSKKAQKKNVAQIVNSVNLDDIDLTHCCAVCKSNFSSKNKLFDHLKKTGHSTYLPEKVVTTKSSKKKQK